MKKLLTKLLSALGLIAIIIGWSSCVKDDGIVSPGVATGYYGLRLAPAPEPQPYYNTKTGLHHYTIELGGAGLKEGAFSSGPAIQVDGEDTLRPLRPTGDNTFLFDFETYNRNVKFNGFGFYYRDTDGNIHWAVHENWQKVMNHFKKYANQDGTLGISFRKGVIEPVPAEIKMIQASIGISKTTFDLNENIALNGSGSSSTEGDITQWTWDLGNGVIKTGAKISYAYTTAGEKTIRLTVKDAQGNTAQDSVVISVAMKKYPYNGPGDDYVGFEFDHQTRKVKIFMNFNYVYGQRGREYVFGCFMGNDTAWILQDKDSGLRFDLDYHSGWGYAIMNYHIPEDLPFIELSFGFAGWYETWQGNDGTHYDFSKANFSHMDPATNTSIYLERYSPDQTYDYHILIYSSGEIKPWK